MSTFDVVRRCGVFWAFALWRTGHGDAFGIWVRPWPWGIVGPRSGPQARRRYCQPVGIAPRSPQQRRLTMAKFSISSSKEWPSGDVNTGFFPAFQSEEKPSSTNLFPSEQMFGQTFMNKASAVVDDRRGIFNFSDVVEPHGECSLIQHMSPLSSSQNLHRRCRRMSSCRQSIIAIRPWRHPARKNKMLGSQWWCPTWHLKVSHQLDVRARSFHIAPRCSRTPAVTRASLRTHPTFWFWDGSSTLPVHVRAHLGVELDVNHPDLFGVGTLWRTPMRRGWPALLSFALALRVSGIRTVCGRTV